MQDALGSIPSTTKEKAGWRERETDQRTKCKGHSMEMEYCEDTSRKRKEGKKRKRERGEGRRGGGREG